MPVFGKSVLLEPQIAGLEVWNSGTFFKNLLIDNISVSPSPDVASLCSGHRGC